GMDTSSRGLRLLPESALLKTGPVDHADWNYSALFGPVQRLRFRLIRKLLQGRRFERLLEIGYGSGIFMPELARYAEHLYGIDPHEMAAEVAAVLAEHGVQAS